MKNIKLKSCPFCGSEDVVLTMNAAGQWRIHCTKCEGIFWVGNSRNKASVYNAWNRRIANTPTEKGGD